MFIYFFLFKKNRFISNKYLRKPTCKDQDVEWAYAFDVHLNAFFPLLIILHIFQLFFYHCKHNFNFLYFCYHYYILFLIVFFSSLIILWFSIVVLISQDGFIARFVGNSFWLIALGYYIYITFLGYSGKFMILYLFNNSAND